MKIGIIIGRIGGVDGVALEAEKWILVLKKMGHEIFILSGQFQNWKMDRTHVEAVLAKRPVFVNNYKPVYWPDIGSKRFKTVMLEDNNLTDKAVEEMKDIIYNKKLNKEIAEYNYALGKKHFSFKLLENKLNELLEIATG